MANETSSDSRRGLEAANEAVIGSLSATPKKFPGRVSKWISRTAAGMAATIIGVWVGAQFWPHWTEYRDRQPPKPDVPSLTQPVIIPAPAPDVTTSLLGTDASNSDKPLQLVLVSTAPGKTLRESTASLGTDPRNPQTYAGGAILANGAVIEEIQVDRVVLQLDGRRATLMIDRNAAARVAMNAVVNEQRTKAGHPVLTPTLSEGPIGPTTVGGRRGSAGQIQNMPTSHEDLSNFIRSQPVFENGRIAGIKLLPGTNVSHLASLGAQSGDVIRSVEGKMIDSASAWEKIDDALMSGRSIVVGIEREGSLTSILLDGSRLYGEPEPSSAMSAPQNL